MASSTIASSVNDWWNIIQFLLTIAGWLAAFYFGVRLQRVDAKDGAKLKVYEEFWKQRSVLQNSSNRLLTLIQSGPPYILMESTAILGNVTRDQQHIWQGQQNALNYINGYLSELQNAKDDYANKFLDFWRSVEMWLHVMPDLETATRTLTSEYSTVMEKVNKYVTHLIMLNRSEWQKWDRAGIKNDGDAVGSDLYNISAYTEDLMKLIHNELVTPMFKYAKDYRKPSDPRYKILTKNGLIAPKI